jgi:hypothetical protein
MKKCDERFVAFFTKGENNSCKPVKNPYTGFIKRGWASRDKEGNLIMTKEKTVERNYSEAQEAEMLAAGIIDNAKAMEFAAKFDKDIKSVRAKAVRMGIYKAAEKVSKTGGKVESKEKIVSDISAIVGKSLDGLEKAPKLVLQIIRTKLSA